MTKPSPPSKPRKPLSAASEVALSPAASAIKKALREPRIQIKQIRDRAPRNGSRRGNTIWENERDPEMRKRLLPLDPKWVETLTLQQAADAELERHRRIREYRERRDQSHGAELRQRVMAALSRCSSDDELARALQEMIAAYVRATAERVLVAERTARSSRGGVAGKDAKRRGLGLDARDRAIVEEWNRLTPKLGERNVASRLAKKHNLSDSQIRRIYKKARM